MKIIDEKIYTGKNIYSHKLCIRLTVDIEDYEEIPTKDIEGFNERLIEYLPKLKKHGCCRGYEGGFLERLNEGTYVPHVMEHVIIELQNLLGFTEIKFGRARQVKGDIYHVIYQYELDRAGILSGHLALNLINCLINKEDFEFEKYFGEMEREIAKLRLGPSTLSIYKEAEKRGIPVSRLGKGSILRLGYGKNLRLFEATITDKTSCIGVDIACDKELTRVLLNEACIPVPRGRCAESLEDAIKASREIGYPVVIKPINGNQGKGVTVNIENDLEAEEAYLSAQKINKKVLVEEYIKGKDFRVLVIDGRVCAVSLRVPPFVLGDGEKTIRNLIEIENNNPQRGFGHEKNLTKIPIDDVLLSYLKRKNMDLDYIPKSGERVILRFNANLSTGGSAKDYTDKIHPKNVLFAVKAAKAVGLDIAGVDICTPDISKPIDERGGAIIEVNAAPGIRMHINPSVGKKRNPASDIFDLLERENPLFSIPIVSVTGTNGKTTTVKLISHILSTKGYDVGMCSSTGIYIKGEEIAKGDLTGPDSAKTVLYNRDVDAAVLETARGGIVRRGLGYNLADVGIITNITGDHLGIDGIETIKELVSVKSLIVEAVKEDGSSILNADDKNTKELLKRAKGRITLISKDKDNPMIKSNIKRGGTSVYIDGDYIVINDGGKIKKLIKFKDIPITFNGRLTYNIENAMAAISACHSLKIDEDVIVKGLLSFCCNDKQNPGRFNIYEFDDFKVVVDYGHNVDGLKSVISALKRFEALNYIGVIGVPGDRKDEDIYEAGRVCADGFDYIYIKEDRDRRGRKTREVARILERGLRSRGFDEKNYRIMLNEGDALIEALRSAKSGDIIAVFYEDYDLIIETLNLYKEIIALKGQGAV